MTADIWNAYWRDQNNCDWWTRPAPEVLTFIAAQSSAEKPDVLDLGCGLGRHAVAFAQAWFRVTAIDASEAAIAYLNEGAHELELSIRAMVSAVLADDLPLGGFDIVLSYHIIYRVRQRRGAAGEASAARSVRQPGCDPSEGEENSGLDNYTAALDTRLTWSCSVIFANCLKARIASTVKMIACAVWAQNQASAPPSLTKCRVTS